MLDLSWVRFGLSGTLIALYSLIDHFARRRSPSPQKPPAPRWLLPLMVASISAFYLLIKPFGGALLGGLGNALGVGLVALAMGLRLGRSVRHPQLAGRALFYVALPIAVGVPWGLLVLSVPALASSLYCCLRAERLQPADPLADSPARYRMLPGIW